MAQWETLGDAPQAQTPQWENVQPTSFLRDVGQLAVGAGSAVAGFPGDTYEFLRNRLLAGTSSMREPHEIPYTATGALLGKPDGSAPTRKETHNNPFTSENIANAIGGKPQDANDIANREAGAGIASALTAKGKLSKSPFSFVDDVKTLFNRARGKIGMDMAEALRAHMAGRANSTATINEIEAADYKNRAATSQAAADTAAENHDALQREFENAGASTDVAKELVKQREQETADAKAVVYRIEAAYLNRPNATAEEFGKTIQDTTEQLYTKYDTKREQQSGFAKAIESAGKAERVNTKDIVLKIEDVIGEEKTKKTPGKPSTIRNPELSRALSAVKEMLQNGKRSSLTVQQADSLRKTLSRMVRTKQALPGERLDSESVHHLLDILGKLKSAITWEPYKEALARYAAYSRDLDIVERNGGLEGVIDKDPFSRNYEMTQARVVGQVIQKAREGNPVLSRLLAENPNLLEPAKLYFTWDLFGKDTVPSEAAFASWLRANERPLEQLGLTDEFKSLRAARQTAKEAVEAASENVRVAKRQAVQQKARERAAKNKAAEAKRKLAKAEKQVEEDKRNATNSAKAATEFRQYESELNAAEKSITRSTEGATTVAKSLAKRLNKKGLISDADYSRIVQDVEKTDREYADRRELIHRLRKLGLTMIILAFAREAYQHNWFAWKSLLGL